MVEFLFNWERLAYCSIKPVLRCWRRSSPPPGLFVEVLLTFLILMIPTGDYYFGFPAGTNHVLNSIIYTGVSFGLIEMVRLSKVYR